MSQCTNVKTWIYHFPTAGTEHSPAEIGDRHSRSRQAGTGAEWDCSGPGYPQSKTSPGISNKTNTSNLLYTCIYNTGIDSKIWISLPLSTEMQWSFSLTYSFVLQHSYINKTHSSPNMYTQSDLPGGKPCVFHASCFEASAQGNSVP